MPLMHGSSKAVFDENVREMIKSGHDPKQAVAAAYSQKRKGKKRKKKPMPPKMEE